MSCYRNTAFALSVTSFLTFVLSFVTPYWLQSWKQKNSPFERIGLWEVCFTAMHDPSIHAYKYYSGCWWIFHSELDMIRPMLTPDWFKAVQAFAVLLLFPTFVAMVTLAARQCNSDKEKWNWVNGIGCVALILSTLCSLICVVVFAACAKDPYYYRLPLLQYSYFGAGFAMMILCCLSSGFGTAFAIAHSLDKNTSKRYED